MIESGTTIDGRYDVVCRVGGGTSGEVFKARRRDGRIVAIKAQWRRTLESTTYFQSLAGQLSEDLENAKQLQGIHGIPTVHGGGEHAGRRYFVMDYIDGQPLSALRAGPEVVADVSRGVIALRARCHCTSTRLRRSKRWW